MSISSPTKQEKIFAERIKEKRIQFGYSLKNAAKEIGISDVALYKYENLLATRITLDQIIKLAELYNTTPSYLCGWEDIKTTGSTNSKIIRFIKDVGQGVITAWSGLTTGFILAVLTGSTVIGGISAIGIMTLILFLIIDPNDEHQKKEYMKKFRRRKLLISMPEIIKENYIYEKFRGNCFFTVGLKDELTTWKHKLLDLLLKTFYFIAYLIKEDKIDDFIQPNKLNEEESIEIIEEISEDANNT